MKAVRIHEYGSVENLQYEQTAVPEIDKHQVLVKVWATSVNHLEVFVASGKMKDQMPLEFPWIPGFDGSGIVDMVGEHIHGFDPGDEVYFKSVQGGTYAEYIALDPEEVVKKPQHLSLTEAASVPHVGLTAWQALFTHGDLKNGQTVLIHGGAGGVGVFAVQFAKYAGATVYTTASSTDQDFVKSLGADYVIDYKSTDFTTVAKDLDLVIDLVGGETQEKSFSVLKNGGRLVTTVGLVKEGEAEIYGVKAIPMGVKPDKDDLNHITEAIETGKLTTDIAIVYYLDEVKKAWETFEHKTPDAEKFTHGKIVLEIK